MLLPAVTTTKLKMKRHHDTDAIYGIRPVIEAIRSGREIDKLLIRRGLTGDLASELKELVREYGIPTQQVPVERFDGFGSKNHQGVVAFVSPIAFEPLEEVVARIWEKGQTPLLVMLDGVTDVRNFGAIARTAECVGAHAIIFPAKGSARIGSDAVKTSAGAIHHIPICRVLSIKSAVSFLKLSGVRVVAATERATTLYSATHYTGPTAIVMGAEDVGLSPETLRLADELVSLPALGRVGSLNVSVAAGVLLYEVLRQRAQ